MKKQLQSQETQVEQLYELTPAQDFHGTTAYVSIPLQIIANKKVKYIPHIICSLREKFELTDENLYSRGLYSNRYPMPLPRWSHKSIEKFLSGENINIQDIFLEIQAIFEEYIDFNDKRWYEFMACWVIGTYFHRLFESYPYVHLNGGMESGKTKTLTLCALLSFNGELTFNSTPSYIVRTIHNNHATCCIDEAESLRNKRDEDSQTVIGMYNSGYKKGQFTGKSEQIGKNKKWIPVRYEAYSPKVFASIKGMESTLASRCIPIVMTRSSNLEIRNREIGQSDSVFQEIRDRLYISMMTYLPAISGVYGGIKDDQIFGREWELWKPILSIASAIDPNLELRDELRNFALEVQQNKKETTLESLVAPKIMKLLIEKIQSDQREDNFYSVKEIVEYLVQEDEENFGWLSDHKNKGRWLGDELRKAGVVKGRAAQKKVEGENVKGYVFDLDTIEEKLRAYE
jgi:hypothetical protein